MVHLSLPRPARAVLRPATTLVVLAALALGPTFAYRVQAGETLSGIASRLGVSTRALAAANGISDPDAVRAGQVLEVPGTSTSGRTHVVGRGETLSGIAGRNGVTVRALAEVNRVGDVHLLPAGQRLVIPGGEAARSSGGGSGGAPRAAAGRADVGRLIESTAGRYGWQSRTLKALAWQESGWNQGTLSSAGAVGIMQVMPSTGRWVGSSVVGRPLDLADPTDNVEAGVAYLDHLYRVTGGDLDLALAGYYQGLRSVRERGMYEDTKQYVANVRALRGRFG